MTGDVEQARRRAAAHWLGGGALEFALGVSLLIVSSFIALGAMTQWAWWSLALAGWILLSPWLIKRWIEYTQQRRAAVEGYVSFRSEPAGVRHLWLRVVILAAVIVIVLKEPNAAVTTALIGAGVITALAVVAHRTSERRLALIAIVAAVSFVQALFFNRSFPLNVAAALATTAAAFFVMALRARWQRTWSSPLRTDG